MRFLTITFGLLAAAATSVLADEVKIEITREVECERRSKKGDEISVHYRGTLADGGKQFDASYDRGAPLSFVLGQGRVIKGWDDNLGGMCIGDKRTLTIPPEFGYGDRGMGPIPASSTLIFETELMGIKGVEAPEPVVEKTPIVSSIASEATEGVKAGIKSKIADAAKVAKVVISDTDDDGQEHNEL